MEFITENWPTISMILLILANVLNSATVHWKEQKGLVKVLTFVSEILSIVSSKGERGLKLPLKP